MPIDIITFKLLRYIHIIAYCRAMELIKLLVIRLRFPETEPEMRIQVQFIYLEVELRKHY